MYQNPDITIKKEFELSNFLIALMSIACAASAANLYYSQPLLEQISRFFNASSSIIGITAMLIQIGYAIGLVFLVPLGDIKERRNLIMIMLLCSAISLLSLSISFNIWWLLLSSLIVGLTSITPMLIVPLVAHIAKPAERGKVIGSVMSGLLIGILLSRVFSGIIGSILGWQIVYRIAAGMMVLLILVFKLWIPKSVPDSSMSYKKLLKSLIGLLRNQPILVESSLIGAMMFGTFSIFWTALSFLLKSPVYNLGAQAAGMFGLAGIIGALAASMVGRIADKRSPGFTLTIAIIISFLSYICFLIFGYQMWGLIIGVILLDLGIQSAQISNQARINTLDATARSRNNAVYMTFYFCGGALGSWLGTFFWGIFGWIGVCGVGIIFQIVAATIHICGLKRR
ncbi:MULTISPECIES: MFS transporter [unclassified Clostridium]|uniref:MFS transporter n=1 Tax=unclassified Clostridium TaxID=2614128 RepID=UPI000297A158|nr:MULTISPECIES: MFS transporter [unclassified Clostridium]EKQ56134.1 MAG: arabinose efflux permease family protein [Clostridium sp. Maddingley MBC34-26]